MIKPNFFVFTGAPGAGKTTLLTALEQHDIAHIHETAREVIRSRKLQNLPPRPDPVTFAKLLFEKDVENFISNSFRNEILLFDRSFPDSAAMLREADENSFKEIEEQINLRRFNNKVFIAPPYREIYTTDEERDQSFEDAVTVYDKLYRWYESCGYELIILPRVSVGERVNFFRRSLASLGMT
ncbi:MAG: AAA family ATPase [Chitinophagaceae bacterium]|nr:AAA family ATPase [Chitinophagaceae bacterium]